MKKKNEGFTLVELVIAVVILAIAITPLVANFITSGKMNLKSRKELNAMNLAQDVMEGMSQYSVKENKTVFEKAVSDNTVLVDGRILPRGTTLTKCELESEDDDKFVYKLTGVKTTVNGGVNNYDARITFNSVENTNMEALNKQELAAVNEIDKERDIVYTFPAAYTIEDVTVIRNHSSKVTTPIDNYDGNLSRDITISISKTLNPTTNKDEYSIAIASVYEVISNLTALGIDGATKDYSTVRYPNMNAAKMPRSLYFYFEGLPGAKRLANGKATENFKIVNTTGEPIDVYLIRTVEETTLTQPTVITANTNYACDVVVDSKTAGIADENVELISNLRFNLTKDNNFRLYQEKQENNHSAMVSEYNSLTQEEKNALVAKYTTCGYKATRSKIYYNSTDTMNEAEYSKLVSDGVKKKNKKLLYTVTLEIYENGKSTKMSTFTGGLSN